MTKISEIKDSTRRLFAFAQERDRIYERKEMFQHPPWTEDPILRDYRFCCVYREKDKVTRWIADNWREPHKNDPDLWFAMCVARLMNKPTTLAALGYPVPWDRRHYLTTMKNLKKSGEKIFNAAYIVSTNGIMASKVVYLADDVLEPLWLARERLRPKHGDTLQSYHVLLGQMQGFGSFMTAQVIADLKYVDPLFTAGDWDTFAASGPGSRRGLNYVLGRPRKSPWTEDEWRLELGRLRERLLPMFRGAGMEEPHAQDVQNLLCEWSKYWRAATEGKMPKQRYRWS
jgi:alpha-glutamyl/putrescinyl thymine pyrophosphorylase clade 1